MPVILLTTVQDGRLKGKCDFRPICDILIQDELPRMVVGCICEEDVIPFNHPWETADKQVISSRVNARVVNTLVADVNEIESDVEGGIDC